VKRFIIPALLMALAWNGVAGAQKYDALLAKVRAKYQKVTNLKATLQLQQCSGETGTCTLYKGKVEFKRPNKLRMDILKPFPQLVACDGITVWQHIGTENKAIKFSLKNAPQMLVWLSPLDKLLSGRTLDGSEEGDECTINLEAAGLPGGMKTAAIVVNRKSLMITGIEAEDLKGNTAHGRFSEIKVNPGLKDSRFTYVPPKNMEIIENK
jgi:outer membrane lipoprotein carrier protein